MKKAAVSQPFIGYSNKSFRIIILLLSGSHVETSTFVPRSYAASTAASAPSICTLVSAPPSLKQCRSRFECRKKGCGKY